MYTCFFCIIDIIVVIAVTICNFFQTTVNTVYAANFIAVR